jgi:dihydroflavonol-4-reductase
MKVLVTGANGLLGANIVEELNKRGADVRIFTRETSDLTGVQDLKYEHFTGDLLDPDAIDRAVEGCDYVIHAAANTSQWPTDYHHYEPVNVNATRHVVDAVKNHRVKRLVFVSSANAFGNGTLERPGTELNEFAGFRLGSGYMISKYIAQQLILDEVERSKLPAIVVNPTFMLGARDSKPSSGQIILMGLNKKVQALPPGGKNFVHVRDVAVATCNALEKGRIGECYLLANENLTYRSFFALLNQITDGNPAYLSIPGWLLKIIGRMGNLTEKITKKGASLNTVNARLLCLDNYYSASKAIEALDLPQTSIDEAIKEALAWFEKNGKI